MPKKCKRCHWSGKAEQLLSQRDDDSRCEDIAAIRFNIKQEYACLCCSLLSGFLGALGYHGRPTVSVSRDDDALVLDEGVGGKEAQRMILYTCSSDGVSPTDAPPFAPPRPAVSCDTSSLQVVDWVRSQMVRCLGNHSRCHMFEEPKLPTRLVHVNAFGDRQDVVLIESSSIPSSSKYVALSHRWGETQIQCLTTAATYAQQRRCITWESLTLTFQDAIDFTRRLGMKYIWTDSMCIIQGDQDDWLREAGNMWSVYQNAQVTLANVHARDGSQGMYSNSARESAFLDRIRFQGKLFQLYTRPEFPSFHDWGPLALPDEAPAFARAWCYQELLISPRVVYFTKDEVLWECFTDMACECSGVTNGIDVDNPKINHIAAFGEEHDQLRREVMMRTTRTAFNVMPEAGSSTMDLSTEEVRRQYRIKQWHNVAEQYTELRLTNVGDRLPAIGAVAKNMQVARQGETYLAGLWSGSLLDDLLWFPMVPVGHRFEPFYYGSQWVAPSWSWASCWGELQYYPLLVEEDASVVAAECSYYNDDPFVSSRSGHLILRSTVIPFRLQSMLDKMDRVSDERGLATECATFVSFLASSPPRFWKSRPYYRRRRRRRIPMPPG